MQKIIAAFDGLKYSTVTQDCAIRLAVQHKAFLTGVFLDDLNYHSYKIYDLISEKEGGIDVKLQHRLNKKDDVVRLKAIKIFESACRKAGIQFAVHKDDRAAIRELIRESIYADLLVVNRTETFSKFKEELPTSFIRQLLPHVQCPVFIVPSSSNPIKAVVLLYDGEPSSVHAIKMLSYVLPRFQDEYTEIVTVKKPGRRATLPGAALVKELIERHFPDTQFRLLKGDPETALLDFLRKKPQTTLVVLGAYRRSTVSRWFRPSMADLLISKLSLPLFIAHNK